MVRDLAELIVKSIVGQPEVITVSQGERGGKRVLHIHVAQKDMARVMGSRGLVIRAIKTILLSSSTEIEDVIIESIPSS